MLVGQPAPNSTDILNEELVPLHQRYMLFYLLRHRLVVQLLVPSYLPVYSQHLTDLLYLILTQDVVWLIRHYVNLNHINSTNN